MVSGFSIVSALATRPGLWGEAVMTLWSLRKRGSFGLSSEVLRWRVATAYGSDASAIDGADLVRYLEWRRLFRHVAGVAL